MRYKQNHIEYFKYPKSTDKTTQREVLQYAIAGMLYMPATRKQVAIEIIEKTKDYKSICLDLEDSVGDDALTLAVKSLAEILKTIYEAKVTQEQLPLIFIRVRTPHQLKHLMEIIPTEHFEVLTGFNFPKFDSNNVDDYIKTFNKLKTQVKTPLYFNPILESKRILNKKTRLAELSSLESKLALISEDILTVRVGATDFCNYFSVRRKPTQSIYDIKVVSDCLVDIVNIFGKNYVVSGPVWEYFGKEEGTWSSGLKRELEQDKLNGFLGKTSIHPSQLKFIEENYIVDYEDYQDSLSILGANDYIGVLKGHGENKMNEIKAHINWAKKINILAEIYGVKKEAN